MTTETSLSIDKIKTRLFYRQSSYLPQICIVYVLTVLISAIRSFEITNIVSIVICSLAAWITCFNIQKEIDGKLAYLSEIPTKDCIIRTDMNSRYCTVNAVRNQNTIVWETFSMEDLMEYVPNLALVFQHGIVPILPPDAEQKKELSEFMKGFPHCKSLSVQETMCRILSVLLGICAVVNVLAAIFA